MNVSGQERTLDLLNAIDVHRQASQRELARHTGVALGLVNSYLKRCVKKGWVKITEAPANRYFYYLTPQGFAEKTRLTTQYLTDSFSFYRQATQSCSALLQIIAAQGKQHLVLAGASDLAEISILKALDNCVNIKAVYDPDYTAGKFLTVPVWNEWKRDEVVDAVIITAIKQPNQVIKELSQLISMDNMYIPDILGLWFGYRNNGCGESK